MIKKEIFFLLTLIVFSTVSAQQKPYLNYGPPLDIPLVFSANFGELRSNHFHMGVDYKTKGVQGVKILAIEKGYIARVKVSSFGYGKVIYINHPNGVTSVYAHCSKFLGELDSIVSKIQSTEQNFEIDYYPQPNEIKVVKGQNIALSGNTGSSTAPHLHFELRDTKSETALNPLLYGFNITDHKSPIINRVKLYSITEQGYISSNKTYSHNLLLKNGTYSTEEKYLKIPFDFINKNGGIGIAIDTYDPYDLSSNKLGIYGSDLKINDSSIFQMRIDSVSFEDTRYINSHKDYYEFSTNHRHYHKSFKTDVNPLPIYILNNNGKINCKIGDTLNLNYSCYDTKGNTSKCAIKIIIDDLKTEIPQNNLASTDYIQPNENKIFSVGKMNIAFTKGTLYEPEIIKIKEGVNEFSIGSRKIPIQKPVHIQLHQPNIPFLKASSYYFTVNDRFLTTSYKNDSLTTFSKYLGDFKIRQDTINPTIKPRNFTINKPLNSNEITWSIFDYQSGINDYDLFIDGKWYLIEYEYKNNSVKFNCTGIKGVKTVKMIVKDNCNNKTEWQEELNFQ